MTNEQIVRKQFRNAWAIAKRCHAKREEVLGNAIFYLDCHRLEGVFDAADQGAIDTMATVISMFDPEKLSASVS